MKQNKFIIISFIGILLIVLIYYPINFLLITIGIKELPKNDNWQIFSPVEEKNIIDKLDNKFNSIKTSIENRVTNMFPLYMEINKTYENFNYKTNNMFYSKEIPLKRNSDNEYVYYNGIDNFYYLGTNYSKKELDERMNKQIEFFNDLSKKNIDINIFYSTRYEFTKLKDNNLSEYVDLFDKNISNKINLRRQNITSIEEYKDNFYLTDHHWNMRGALKGYYDIMDMLNKEPIKGLKIKEVKDVNYYGSMAKSSMTKNISDTILDVDIDLDYKVSINGKEPSELFKPRKISKRKNEFHDYYVQYFNGQYGNIIYDYNNNEENLLILCDSFAWQIDYLIAASFNKTHVINLRYDQYLNNELDLEKYMKDNNINKVLFLYEGESILFDQYNYNFQGRVK